MRVYFDKENLKSFLASQHLGEDLFSDCKRMLSKQLDNYFYFLKNDISKDDYDVIAYMKLLGDGRGDDDGRVTKFIDESSGFPEKPFKGNCCTYFDKNQLSSIFLVNEEKAHHIRTQRNIVIGEVGAELETLGTLIYNDYQFTDEKKIQSITSWDDIGNWVKPCSDILIIDNFIFKPQEEGSPLILENNLYRLLRTLIVGTKVNLVIYTQGKEQEVKTDTDYWKNTVIGDLKKWLKRNLSQLQEINVTVILAQRGKQGKAIKMHDRNIISNYYRIFSGDSFNYFDENNRVNSRGCTVETYSFANKERHKVALSIIDSVQSDKDEIQRLNPDHIIGDRKSNLVNF